MRREDADADSTDVFDKALPADEGWNRRVCRRDGRGVNRNAISLPRGGILGKGALRGKLVVLLDGRREAARRGETRV